MHIHNKYIIIFDTCFYVYIFLIKYLFLIVKCVMSTPAYFAEKLYKSMKVQQKKFQSLCLFNTDVCIKIRTVLYYL